MEISDDMLCLFTARIEERDGTHVIEVPARELDVGDVSPDGTYRVALLEPGTGRADGSGSRGRSSSRGRRSGPPVSEGEIRDVEIEDMGEQGDGLARVERGYVVFVSGVEVGAEPTVEITDVRENFAFGRPIGDGTEPGS